jgi:hypothetical protein
MILRWLGQKALLLVIILALLVLGVWIRGEWAAMSSSKQQIEEKQAARKILDEHAVSLQQRIERLQRSGSAMLLDLKEKTRHVDAAWNDLRDLESERARLWNRHWWARKNPFSSVYRKIALLDAGIAVRRNAVSELERRKNAARKLVDASPELSEARDLLDELRQTRTSIGDLGRQIDADEKRLNEEPVQKLLAEVDRQLPMALALLAGIILLPIAIRAGVYFLLAPLVGRISPIRILPESNGIVLCAQAMNEPQERRGRISSVSCEVAFDAGHELLVHADYLQSSPLAARKKTRWFLNPRLPFSSIASGLFALVSIRSERATSVVVSSSRDPLSEVALLVLPEGSALVCQPRSLAGVLQQRDTDIRITRHWRLFSVHAWLTMQLRYLVFHGPCTLIVKGCRGVRVEQAQAGRLINQAATLAFSANVGYANTRCETFISYWTGKEDLFNDSFSGTPGVYVYEELPDVRRRSGITGRGVEGVMDAVLKVFGV